MQKSSPSSNQAGSPPENQNNSSNASKLGFSSKKNTGGLTHHGLPKLRGHIELIIGPMFAGKSTELMRRMKRHEIAGNRCLKIKFAEDTRYSGDSIATHDR